MTKKNSMNLNKLLLLAFLLSIQLVASGQTTTLTLDNVPSNTLCNEIWTEQNLDLSFVTATSDDCGEGSCFFGIESTYVWLYPSRLSVDLSSLQEIYKVELDVISYCGSINPQCTFAHLMDSNGMIINTVGNTINNSGDSNNGTLETLIIENPSEGFLSELAISSCEGNIHEIRIYQNVLSNGQIGLDNTAFVGFEVTTTLVRDYIAIKSFDSFNLSIYDSRGRNVKKKKITTETKRIPVGDLPSGIYFVRVVNDQNASKTNKIIKL